MTYSPYTNDKRTPEQGVVLGCFDNSEFGTFFEYAERTVTSSDWKFKPYWAPEYKHLIFMSNGTTRLATIKKTVAYIVIDEAPNGEPISEKWSIKRHRKYI